MFADTKHNAYEQRLAKTIKAIADNKGLQKIALTSIVTKYNRERTKPRFKKLENCVWVSWNKDRCFFDTKSFEKSSPSSPYIKIYLQHALAILELTIIIFHTSIFNENLQNP